jgi:hypothetical protein
VHSPASVFGRAVLDEGLEEDQWLPVVGARGWAVIGRDQRILERDDELRAYLDARLHMFLLPGEVTREQIIELLAINLMKMCVLAVARKPNVYWLTRHGVESYERRIERRSKRRNQRRRSPRGR